MTYRFFEKDPGTAYITNNLLLPKAGIRIVQYSTGAGSGKNRRKWEIAGG